MFRNSHHARIQRTHRWAAPEREVSETHRRRFHNRTQLPRCRQPSKDGRVDGFGVSRFPLDHLIDGTDDILDTTTGLSDSHRHRHRMFPPQPARAGRGVVCRTSVSHCGHFARHPSSQRSRYCRSHWASARTSRCFHSSTASCCDPSPSRSPSEARDDLGHGDSGHTVPGVRPSGRNFVAASDRSRESAPGPPPGATYIERNQTRAMLGYGSVVRISVSWECVRRRGAC